jgi:uncharacterized protein YkwD
VATGSAVAAPRKDPQHGARRAHQACRTHTKHAKRHAPGCKSRAARHSRAHRHGAGPRRTAGAHQAARPRHSRAHKHGAGPRQTAGRRHSATALRSATQIAPRGEQAVEAARIAEVLATPCQNTEVTPEEGNLQAVGAATFCLVNQERARHDEMPLQLNADLEAAAEEHSQEMVSQDYFAHVAPNGLTPVERVRGTGYIPSPEDGYTIGENIAWGTLELSTPKAIVAAWIASPEHLANILEANYRDGAIGVDANAPASLANGQHGAVYTEEFGVIVG